MDKVNKTHKANKTNEANETDKAEIFSTLTMNYGFPCCIKTVEETVNGKIFLLLFYIIWYKAAQQIRDYSSSSSITWISR